MDDAASGVTPLVMARRLVLVGLLALTACGKQGPLYMPPPKPVSPHAAPHKGPRS
jgi:predicted small lipoprotein YifL